MLLIIDNFEHVVAAASVLGRIITQTDHVMLLVPAGSGCASPVNAWSRFHRWKCRAPSTTPMCCGTPTRSNYSSTVNSSAGVQTLDRGGAY
jgi:hypothetical protein